MNAEPDPLEQALADLWREVRAIVEPPLQRIVDWLSRLFS